MKVKIQVCKDFESILESKKIRNEVFVHEQGIPFELDSDGWDDKSHHVLAYANNQVVGVARLALIENNEAVLARVAVKKECRGFGIASKIVQASIKQAEKLNVSKIEISPHEHLKEFYESFGFKYVKKSEKVATHQLIKMEKHLSH